MIANLVQELRYALRTLASQPMFALVAVLTLALGIGANTAIFSVIHGMYLRPLPYAGGERLVSVYNTYPKMGLEFAGTSIPDYLDRRGQAPSLEDLTMYTNGSYNLADGGSQPERLNGLRATPSFFSTLQVAPALGQAFTEAQAVPGQDRVVVISHALWSNRFNADPTLVGRDVRLNGEPFRVIGVMPQGFAFPNRNVQLWVPFAFTPDQMSDSERGNEFSNSVGRLREGATLEALNAEMDVIVQRNVERIGSTAGFNAVDFIAQTGFTGRATSLREQQVGEARVMLLVLQAAVAMVLLIACANVANLMLTRVVARQKELSVRNALGATRWRIARQLLVDALLLAVVGGGLGLLLAWVLVDLMPLVGVQAQSSDYDFRIDGTVLAFSLCIAIAAGVLAAVLPMYSLLRMNINDVIKEGGRLGSGGRRAAASRNVLVVAQIALATTLLIGAGLLLKSFKQLQEQSPGFRSEGVLTALISLPSSKYPDGPAQVRFLEEALTRLRALPGVSSAGFTQSLPFSGNNSQGSYAIDGYTAGEGQPAPHGMQRYVDEAYFETLAIQRLQGRGFTPADDATAAPVVIIDRLLAEKYFKGQDPIGKRLVRGGTDGDGDGGPNWATVVGVVDTVKHSELREETSKETLYWPLRQTPQASGAFVVKTAVTPDSLIKPVRDTILAIDSEQPLFGIQSLDERIAVSLNQQRAPMLLLAAFAGVALVLSAIGIYGVLAYSVGQRTSELGVRMAIGAGRSHILGLILRHGAILTAIGLGLGLVGAFAGGQAMRSQLFGVSGSDPAIFVLVTLFLAAIALLSCYLPARRATRVDPLAALRHE
jgi:predicted permease